MVQQHSSPTSSHVDLGEDTTEDEEETSDVIAAGNLMQDDVVDLIEEEMVPDTEEKGQGLGTDDRSQKSDTPSQPISRPEDAVHRVGKIFNTPICKTPMDIDYQVA